MSRVAVLSDAQWARIEPLMPSPDGERGRPFRNHRQVLAGIIYRLRTGIAWRDPPQEDEQHAEDDRSEGLGVVLRQALEHLPEFASLTAAAEPVVRREGLGKETARR